MSETETLRELLLTDLSTDLPIRGGSGSKAAPIVVTSPGLQPAVDAQMEVLRCLGAGRRVAWRLTGQEVVVPEQKLVRAAIETVAFADREVVTQQEGLYFVVEALPAHATTTSLPAPSGFVDPRSGVPLPYQLGWLHLSGATDNEPDNPGLGWTVAYDALAIKGIVCVYDQRARLTSDDVGSDRVIEEFRTAVGEALGVNPGAEVKHQAMFRDPSGRGRCLLAILDVPGDSMSAVLLSARNGCFVKARVTFDATERHFGRMAHESMEAFVDAVRPGPAMTS
jgi:hypothetical protein